MDSIENETQYDGLPDTLSQLNIETFTFTKTDDAGINIEGLMDEVETDAFAASRESRIIATDIAKEITRAALYSWVAESTYPYLLKPFKEQFASEQILNRFNAKILASKVPDLVTVDDNGRPRNVVDELINKTEAVLSDTGVQTDFAARLKRRVICRSLECANIFALHLNKCRLFKIAKNPNIYSMKSNMNILTETENEFAQCCSSEVQLQYSPYGVSMGGIYTKQPTYNLVLVLRDIPVSHLFDMLESIKADWQQEMVLVLGQNPDIEYAYDAELEALDLLDEELKTLQDAAESVAVAKPVEPLLNMFKDAPPPYIPIGSKFLLNCGSFHNLFLTYQGIMVPMT